MKRRLRWGYEPCSRGAATMETAAGGGRAAQRGFPSYVVLRGLRCEAVQCGEDALERVTKVTSTFSSRIGYAGPRRRFAVSEGPRPDLNKHLHS